MKKVKPAPKCRWHELTGSFEVSKWGYEEPCPVCWFAVKHFYDQFFDAVLEVSVQQHARFYYDQFLCNA